jgi:MazG family protein
MIWSVMNSIKPKSFPGVQLFLDTVNALRHPTTGCPWDLAQTHETLMKYFHEELHEFQEALTHDGPSSPKTWDELGDLLLQVGLHSKIAEEAGHSSFDDIAKNQAEKLIRRHPHVFDPAFPKFKNAEEVSANWEKIKAWSKQSTRESSLGIAGKQIESKNFRSIQVSSVPHQMPALLRSSRIGEKAAAFSFDWPYANLVLEKIQEECDELKKDQNDELRAFEELGDLLFACSQYARKRGWDPEQVLHQANEKFLTRFEKLEKHIQAKGQKWDELSLAELEEGWGQVKKDKSNL